MAESWALAQRWRDACLAEEQLTTDHWPEAQSVALVGAVLEPTADRAAVAADIDRAARAWSHAQPKYEVLSRRLLVLRGLLAVAPVPVRGPSLEDLWEVVAVTANEEFALSSQRAALSDPLTGAGNRRALELGWEAARAQCTRLGQPVCLVAVDLDGLKLINDGRGHAAGDEAIVTLVAALRAGLRGTDHVYRIGGDEFVVLLPGAPAAGADELVDRVRPYHPPAFSWGAADSVQDGSTLSEVLACADRRLYAQRSRVRDPLARAELRPLPARPSRWLPAFATSRARAGEMAVMGAASLVIGAVAMTIAGGNHAACGAGSGTTVADCGLSNAVYFGAIVLLVVGGILATLALVACVVLRGQPSSHVTGGTMVQRADVRGTPPPLRPDDGPSRARRTSRDGIGP
jgi:diguanylate cyclase (GGDEF)-like protein